MSFFKDALLDVLPIIEKGAPILATALGSPLAGIAVSALASAFDVKNNHLPSIIDNIKSSIDPDNRLLRAETEYTSYFTQRPLQSAELTVKLQWGS